MKGGGRLLRSMLYLDPQTEDPACFCPRCGGECYKPSFFCLKCGKNPEEPEKEREEDR